MTNHPIVWTSPCARPRVGCRSGGSPAATPGIGSPGGGPTRRHHRTTRTGPSGRSERRRTRSRRAAQIRASSSPSVAPRVASSRSAHAAANSRAADDERPAPSGRSEAMTPRMPWTGSPAVAQGKGRARDIIDPGPVPRAIDVEVESQAFPCIKAGQLHPTVLAGERRDVDLPVDRGRQNEPQVVVGVLADQVDPAGRADDADRRPVGSGGGFARDKGIDQPFAGGRAAGHRRTTAVPYARS